MTKQTVNLRWWIFSAFYF